MRETRTIERSIHFMVPSWVKVADDEEFKRQAKLHCLNKREIRHFSMMRERYRVSVNTNQVYRHISINKYFRLKPKLPIFYEEEIWTELEHKQLDLVMNFDCMDILDLNICRHTNHIL